MSDAPPPEVVAAAQVVENWVRKREAAIGTTAPAADKTAGMSWAERIDRARTFDQSKMPAWKDPRLP